jgi:hypothetical protein
MILNLKSPAQIIDRSSKKTNNNKLTASVIDTIIIERAMEQIKQQTLLEMNIVDEIIEKIDSWILLDQNELLVMLACFKYKVYLQDGLLESLLELN